MSWTRPRTWSAEPINLDKLNAEIRDNFDALKNPPTDVVTIDSLSAVNISSTSWVDVTGFELTVDSKGGDILICFAGNVDYILGVGYLDIEIDGFRVGSSDGIVGIAYDIDVAINWLVQEVASGSHVIKLKAKVASSSINIDGQFWAREIS